MKRLFDWIRVGLVDLRGDVRRFGVLIACLALGTAAIAAVGSVGAGLNATVLSEATTLMGGDLEAVRPDRGADPGELAYLESLGAVAQVIDANARIVAGDESAFADIVAVADAYPLLGSVVSPQLVPGERPSALLAARDGVFGAIVDELVFERLAIGPGGRFELGGRHFEIRGTLTSLPDGAVRGLHLGLTTVISTVAFADLEEIRQPLPGLLTQHRYKVLLNDGITYEQAATAIEERLEPGWLVRSPRDAAGSLARYYDLFLRYLLILGLASLLVGGVGVSIAVTTYIAERQRSIATMRSLGATGMRVLVHFLSQIAVLTLVGVVIGVVAGAAVAAVGLPIIGNALGVPARPSFDPAPLLTAAGFGLLAGFVFSYVSLAGARQVSPVLLFRSLGAAAPRLTLRAFLMPSVLLPMAAAIAGIYGLALWTTGDPFLVNAFAGGLVAAFALLRGATFVLRRTLNALPESPLSSLRQAVRNIHGPGSTADVVVLSLGLGLSMLLVIAVLNGNLRDQLLGAISHDSPTFVATDVFMDEIAEIGDIIASDEGYLSLTWRPSIRARVLRANGTDMGQFADMGPEVAFLLGVDIPVTWSAEEPPEGRLIAGEWWPADYTGPQLVSLHNTLMTELGLEVGDSIEFDIFGDPITATIANFRDYQWFNGLNFMVVFSPGEIQDYPSTFLANIKAAPGFERALERQLNQALPEIAFIPVGDALNQAVRLLGQLATGVNLVGSLAVVNGLFVLAGTMAAGRKRREADAVVQKVLGATRRRVLWDFTLEYSLLGAFAAILASIIGVAAAWVITDTALGVGFGIDLALIAVVVAGAVALTVAAGALTTWRSLATSPARYLRAAQ